MQGQRLGQRSAQHGCSAAAGLLRLSIALGSMILFLERIAIMTYVIM